MDWLDLLAVQGILKSLPQHHSSKASILQRSVFFMVQLADGDTETWCEAGHALQALKNGECGMTNYNKIFLWPSLVAQW